MITFQSGTEIKCVLSKHPVNKGLIELDWETQRERTARRTRRRSDVCVWCVKPLAQPLLTSRLYLSAERGNLPAARLRSPLASPSQVICHFRPIFTWLLRQKWSDTEVARLDWNVDATQTLYTHRLKMRSGLKRGRRKKTFPTLSTCSRADKMSCFWGGGRAQQVQVRTCRWSREVTTDPCLYSRPGLQLMCLFD